MTADGRVALVEQGSAAADAEQVAVLTLTRLGERPLVPGFGTVDPAFAGLDATDLAAALALWGPPVALEGVDVVERDDHSETVEVTFR